MFNNRNVELPEEVEVRMTKVMGELFEQIFSSQRTLAEYMTIFNRCRKRLKRLQLHLQKTLKVLRKDFKKIIKILDHTKTKFVLSTELFAYVSQTSDLVLELEREKL